MTPVALTIAGSDSGGGAGIQADLKTFSALGVFGTSAIAAVTAQNTVGVRRVESVSDEMIEAQIAAVLEDFNVKAVKIGMLGSANAIKAVAKALKPYEGPVVLDPVMIAKSGDSLLAEDAISALIETLLPGADLLTPNLPEAARLLNAPQAEDPEQAEKHGRELLELGPDAVLVKGGHAKGEICQDVLVKKEGVVRFSSPRVDTPHTHGTGCSFSSAIAARLAKGDRLENAIRNAHAWLHEAIRLAPTLSLGKGRGPVHHFHGIWE